MKTTAIIAALLLVGTAAQFVPIPSRYDGFQLGDDSAPLLVEAYYDMMCPDSRASWPVVQKVLNHYGNSTVKFIMHVFPLPYHHNSFLAGRVSKM